MMDRLNEYELREYFAQQDDVEFALIFGSVASGHNTLLSDIDIAVYFGEGRDALELSDRQIDVTCAMMRRCKVNYVDVVILNLANPFLKFQVLKNGHPLYVKDEKKFYRFKAASFGIYQDIKPMYDLYNRFTEVGLRKGMNG